MGLSTPMRTMRIKAATTTTTMTMMTPLLVGGEKAIRAGEEWILKGPTNLTTYIHLEQTHG